MFPYSHYYYYNDSCFCCWSSPFFFYHLHLLFCSSLYSLPSPSLRVNPFPSPWSPTSSSSLFVRFPYCWWRFSLFCFCSFFVLFLFISDINECTASSPVCHVSAQCNNTLGSYRCICNPGYTYNGKRCTGTQGNVIRKYGIRTLTFFEASRRPE